MKKILLYLNLLSLCLTFGCSNDEFIVKNNEFGSSLEVNDDYKVSLFTLPNKLLQVTKAESNIQVELQSHSNGEILTLDGEIREVSETIRGAVFIPKQTKIADSDYDIILRDSNGDSYGSRFKVSIKGEMFCTILEEQIVYKGLRGSGSEAEPYLIKDVDEFNSFMSNLLRDSLTHGANLYFKQENDIIAPTDGEISDNQGYVPLPFAGNYNGDKHEITEFYYSGSGSDKNIGFFSELLDGAVVKNLHLDILYINNAEYVGGIAGSTKGNVTLSNISVSGSIDLMGHQFGGGLVGYASGGKLTINNSSSYMKIIGTDNIGGLIGRADNNIVISMQNDTVSKMTLTGDKYVGGAIGYLDGSIEASGVLISHTVDNGTTKVIIAESSYAGGLIGYALINNDSSIKDAKIKCPVESLEDVGGLIGNLTSSADIDFKGCEIANSITGQTNVGGLIGNIDSKGGTIIFNESNKIAVTEESNISIYGNRTTTSENIGGAIGQCQNATFDFKAPIEIAVNVTGDNNIGGFCGKIIGADQSTLTISKAWTNDNMMHVEGKKNVGGFIGYAENITIQDKMEFELKADANNARIEGISAFSGSVGNVSGTSENNGGIVGNAHKCTFKNIYVDGSVYGLNNTGGILGYGFNTDFYYCVSNLTELGGLNANNGGIGGYLEDSNLENCVNYTTITNGSNCVGGLVGNWESYYEDVSILSSVNVGKISGNKNVGGLVGRANSLTPLVSASYIFYGNIYIKNSANFGLISGTGTNTADDTYGLGGLLGCGFFYINIYGCANHGNVSGYREYHGVGGIAGTVGKDPTGAVGCSDDQINSNCNFGTISAEGSSKLGGVVGYQEEGKDKGDSLIENCYNMGEIPSDCSDDTGGVLGVISSRSTLRYTYNAGRVSHGNAVIGTHSWDRYYEEDNYFLKGSGKGWKGTGLSEDDMKDLDSFNNFNRDIWLTDPDINNGYPYLANCPFQFATFSL